MILWGIAAVICIPSVVAVLPQSVDESLAFCQENGQGLSATADCSQMFSACLSDGSRYTFKCPFSQVFDPLLKTCLPSSEVASCISSGIDSTNLDIALPPTDASLSSVCGSHDDGFYPSSSCSVSVIMCRNGDASLMECPSDLVFSSQHGGCVPVELLDECKKTQVGSDNANFRSLEGCYSDGLFEQEACSSYFQTCSGGISRIMACPAGLVYDQITAICDYASNVPECKSTQKQASVCGNDGFYSYGNCSNSFYSCVAEQLREMYCPSTLVYNSKTSSCDYPSEVEECQGQSFDPSSKSSLAASDSFRGESSTSTVDSYGIPMDSGISSTTVSSDSTVRFADPTENHKGTAVLVRSSSKKWTVPQNKASNSRATTALVSATSAPYRPEDSPSSVAAFTKTSRTEDDVLNYGVPNDFKSGMAPETTAAATAKSSAPVDDVATGYGVTERQDDEAASSTFGSTTTASEQTLGYGVPEQFEDVPVRASIADSTSKSTTADVSLGYGAPADFSSDTTPEMTPDATKRPSAADDITADYAVPEVQSGDDTNEPTSATGSSNLSSKNTFGYGLPEESEGESSGLIDNVLDIIEGSGLTDSPQAYAGESTLAPTSPVEGSGVISNEGSGDISVPSEEGLLVHHSPDGSGEESSGVEASGEGSGDSIAWTEGSGEGSGEEPHVDCATKEDGFYAVGCSSKIIACSGGVTYNMMCPADLIFDQKNGRCDYRYLLSSICEGSGDGFEEAQNDDIITNDSDTEGSGSKVSFCGENGATSTVQCSQSFELCFDGISRTMNCDLGYLFSQDLARCVKALDLPECSPGSPVSY